MTLWKAINRDFVGLFQYLIKKSFICRLLDSSVSEDAGIETEPLG